MRVRAVRLAAVRRDGGCARRRAQFVAKNAGKYEKNAEKSEKTRKCAVLPKNAAFAPSALWLCGRAERLSVGAHYLR